MSNSNLNGAQDATPPEPGPPLGQTHEFAETRGAARLLGAGRALKIPRKLDLALAVLPTIEGQRPVQPLIVRELKGVGAAFTSDIDAALSFFGLVFKAAGMFDTQFQILAGDLLQDPRLMRRAKRLVFVPAYAWSALEVVLMPIRFTSFGVRTFVDLQKLQPRFPRFRAWVEWDEIKRRHVIYESSLTDAELDLIRAVSWPTQTEILEALEVSAFGDIDALAAANDEVRALLSAKAVE